VSGIDVEEEWKILIGGEHVSTENHYDIIDPNTTEVIGHAPEATDQHAIEAAAAAKEALRSWKALSMDERCGYIGRAADAIESACGDWVNLVQAETGATIRVARTMQVAGAFVDRFRYYSRPHEMEQPLAPLYSAASALAPESLIQETSSANQLVSSLVLPHTISRWLMLQASSLRHLRWGTQQ